ncbi:ClpP family protease [Devriesea agamarum]|uniref:ClpP family protease n=1 Tax=Devriesea agamarum TaxID=472569 RepID=UPI00071CC2A2|nr:ATP-dependent Clp protease proteolytic subunit [Devriesea agamarum]
MNSSYTIPSVTERLPSGSERVSDVFSRLLSDRIVYLGTGIDDGVANTVIAQLLHLENASPDSVIDIILNSEGGHAGAVLAIVDTMRYVRCPVAVTCVGQAVAASALVLAAGARGRRALLPHAQVVLSPVSAQSRGAIPDLILQAEEVERIRHDTESLLAACSGRTLHEVRAEIQRDRVLTAQGAVEYGLADSVLAPRDTWSG